MTKRRYAQDTSVPVSRSIDQIRDTVAKYDGEQFTFGMSDKKIMFGFTRDGRQVRFSIAIVERDPQEQRSAMRSMLLVIKAKLEAVASGISIFEDEFLANIVLPDGSLVGQNTRAQIAAAYEGGQMPDLLPNYSAEQSQ